MKITLSRLCMCGALVALLGANLNCTTKPKGGGGGDDDCEDSTDCNDDEVCDDGECKTAGVGGAGVGGSAGSATQSGGGPGSGGTGAVGASGSGGCDLGTDGCVGCGELITFPGCLQTDLCAASQSILSALLECVCSFCSFECSSTACATPAAQPDSECSACAQMQCPSEASTCANDISD